MSAAALILGLALALSPPRPPSTAAAHPAASHPAATDPTSTHAVQDTSWIPDVRVDTLANGMVIQAVRRGSAPTAAFVVQYRVGGVDDPPGSTGMAHLLEHLLFKGTTELGTTDRAREAILLQRIDGIAAAAVTDSGIPPSAMSEIRALEDSARAFSIPNEFDRILTGYGARGLNAVTTAETTTYFVELPANRAERWFALEGHRMADPVLREFFTERDVVLEERSMRVEGSPAGRLQEAHLALAFPAHPYGRPVVGTVADLESMTRDPVRDFHRTYYGARNAVVTVVGDVSPDSVMAWAERYFSAVPPGRVPPAPQPGGGRPDRSGPTERQLELEVDAQPLLRMGWRVPDGSHPDAPALAMLSVLLTGSRSARLHRSLVRDRGMASSVSSSTEPGSLYPGLFVIAAEPRASIGVPEIEAAIDGELRRLAIDPPGEDELDRVRSQLEASRVRRLRTNLGLALQLSDSRTLWGDWRWGFAFIDRMTEVTAGRISEVVREYFTPENLTVVWIPGRTDG